MITLSERAAAALENARRQALRNGNMGQIDGYRLNHVVILVERIEAETRELCARIADEEARGLRNGACSREFSSGAINAARSIAARIREGWRGPVAAAPLPDLEGAAPVAENDPHG